MDTQERLDSIFSFGLEVTTYCNLKCPQCGRMQQVGEDAGKFASSYLQLKHWDADKILPNFEIERLRNLKFVRIEGDNGDAIMHPKIEKIVECFYNAPTKPNILILTNGSLRSTNWWKEFGAKFPKRVVVQFSIDGAKDTNHIYRLGSNYDKIIANVKAYMEGGGIATTRAIIFKHNEHQLEEIYNNAKELGFKQLLMIPNEVSRFFMNETYHEVFDNGVKLYDIHPTKYNAIDLKQYCYNELDLELYPKTKLNPKFICPTVAMGEITVTYQGYIIPCCMINSDYDFKDPKNDYWREIVGDRSTTDLHTRKLSEILCDPTFYHHRLEQTLKDGKLYHLCESFCSKIINRRFSEQ